MTIFRIFRIRCGLRMPLAKKLKVHRNIHIDVHGHKVVTLENVEVYCTPWCINHAILKVGFDKFWEYSSMRRPSWLYRNFGTKKSEEATLQATTILFSIIVTLTDAISHKIVIQMVLPMGTKCKTILTNINELYKNKDVVPFLCPSWGL